MLKTILKTIALVSLLFMMGCSIPKNTQWHKDSTAEATTKSDISFCKVNTFMWWPFETLHKCMTRRGYKLVSDAEKQKMVENVEQVSISNALLELKKLRDAGAITEEEYEGKKSKYLSKL